jgi:hypothetical protein
VALVAFVLRSVVIVTPVLALVLSAASITPPVRGIARFEGVSRGSIPESSFQTELTL